MNLVLAQSVAPTRPLWQDVLVSATGPLVAALVGSLAVGIVLSALNGRRSKRVEAVTRRISTIEDMVTGAGSFRAALYLLRGAVEGGIQEEVDDARADARGSYKEAVVAARLIEIRLDSYFHDTEIASHWHAVMDCLKMYYFLYSEQVGDQLDRARNRYAVDSEMRHSGLSFDQLGNPDLVIAEAQQALGAAVALARVSRLKAISHS